MSCKAARNSFLLIRPDLSTSMSLKASSRAEIDSERVQLFAFIYLFILLDFSLTVKAATLIFISGCGSAISSAKYGKSGFIYMW